MSERQKLLVLDDTVLLAVANRAEVVAAYPFLERVKSSTPGKPRCGACAKKATQQGNVFASVKLAIAELPDADKIRLKEVLNTAQVRVRYNRRQDGRMIELTF